MTGRGEALDHVAWNRLLFVPAIGSALHVRSNESFDALAQSDLGASQLEVHPASPRAATAFL